MRFSTLPYCLLLSILPGPLSSLRGAEAILQVEAVPYPGRDPAMWDGVYAASDGRVYSALITEGSSAHFYQYDPATRKNVLLADIASLLGERGRGIRTAGKIHNRPLEDRQGMIYFATNNNGSGPQNIDYLSWEGGRWVRFDPRTAAFENLGLVERGVGVYPTAIDAERNLLYTVGFTGYLYQFDLQTRISRKLGRVANWDVCRNIFIDDEGNVFGPYPVGRIWKYDLKADRILNLAARVPYDPTIYPTQLVNPMIDRSMDWRAVMWDPVEKVAYGVTCGSGSLLFRFDPHQGKDGEVTALEPMSDPRFWKGDRKDIPYSTLAFALDSRNRKVYFAPSAREYAIDAYEETFGSSSGHHLILYDIGFTKRVDLGMMQTADGRRVFGSEGATVGPDGTVYLVAQVEVADSKDATRTIGKIPVALHLVVYRP